MYMIDNVWLPEVRGIEERKSWAAYARQSHCHGLGQVSCLFFVPWLFDGKIWCLQVMDLRAMDIWFGVLNG